MGARDFVFELIDQLFEFGRVRSSAQTASAKTVTVDIEGSVDGDSVEQARGQGFWGHAAIMARPKAPTTSPEGECEVFYVRRGEEMVSIASRDLRWQVDLSEGDVVVRNLDGTTPVRLHLLADGTAVLEADTVKIGDASATEKIALGTTLKTYLDTLRSELEALRALYNAHVHSGVTTGVGSTAVPTVPSPTAFTSPPDIESRHVVES